MTGWSRYPHQEAAEAGFRILDTTQPSFKGERERGELCLLSRSRSNGSGSQNQNCVPSDGGFIGIVRGMGAPRMPMKEFESL
jgi:hypothetical protein